MFALALVLLAAWSGRALIGTAAAVAVGILVELIGLIATMRRLHDAGWSRWWLLLYLFPLSVTVDLLTVRIGPSAWHFLDVSAAIKFVPIIIGLLVSSRSARADNLTPVAS